MALSQVTGPCCPSEGFLGWIVIASTFHTRSLIPPLSHWFSRPQSPAEAWTLGVCDV